ncbi:hypothetical protein [Alkalihalobacterium alkalinitrilicum]|uniref:hypothetical protein n=1 Tax=Alkalihalobacterium alkalinitrilicum TaxID=427920 RepID=UPI0009957059|nr:hypothetical protein [Alkalihalobacterium alkalinitrilicum]
MTKSIKILTDNQLTVLPSLTNIFSRFGVMIEKLMVKAIENAKFLFIKVSIYCDDIVFNRLIKQVEKQIEVISVKA